MTARRRPSRSARTRRSQLQLTPCRRVTRAQLRERLDTCLAELTRVADRLTPAAAQSANYINVRSHLVRTIVLLEAVHATLVRLPQVDRLRDVPLQFRTAATEIEHLATLLDGFADELAPYVRALDTAGGAR